MFSSEVSFLEMKRLSYVFIECLGHQPTALGTVE